MTRDEIIQKIREEEPKYRNVPFTGELSHIDPGSEAGTAMRSLGLGIQYGLSSAMGDKFGDLPAEKPLPAAASETYTPPDINSLYTQYQQTGRVPYSYYGVGAPTRESELALVKKSYPGAFSPAQPQGQPSPGTVNPSQMASAAVPQIGQVAAPLNQATDPLSRLKMALGGRRA